MSDKKCEFCGALLVRKSWETPHNFGKRIYCNNLCKISGQKKKGHWRSDLNLKGDNGYYSIS
jgi:hypothetical protein